MFSPVDEWGGRDQRYPLTVGYATAERRPRAEDVRKLWKARHGNVPNPLLLVVAYPDGEEWKAAICGPAGDEPPVESGLDLGQVERLADAALNEPSRHAAIRFLSAMWAELETELPGLRNAGMLASHELRDGVPTRADWEQLCDRGRPLLDHHGRDLVQQLGFTIEARTDLRLGSRASPTPSARSRCSSTRARSSSSAADRFGATSPVSYALALADREDLPWVVATRGRQIRVYSARPDVGVGRKGRAETYIEANLALLPDDRAGYVPLLFSADALVEQGHVRQVLEGRATTPPTSARGSATASTRTPCRRSRWPSRHAMQAKLDEEALEHVYEQALTVLFRLLFVAYAEDKDLLPYRSNGAYREHALKTRARELAERAAAGTLDFDEHATDLWDEVATLWLAVDKGNTERGVPAYNGGLFSSDPSVSEAGAALADVRLTNAEFGPALVAMLVDEADGVPGPVDFRSLSVREFGTIYEGLLESSLSVAPSDLTLDAKSNYVPARRRRRCRRRRGRRSTSTTARARGSRPAVTSRSRSPSSTCSTMPSSPRSTTTSLESRRCSTPARRRRPPRRSSTSAASTSRWAPGHFLVAAVDRIEARLSGFLALRPIPQVVAELDRLRAAALEALGPLGEGAEIEHASLLRRQVARRCVYGVDLNPIAVELARLAIWIHTFVPGLPLSFLDHTLVRGNSLTGIGTLEEAVAALDPGADTRARSRTSGSDRELCSARASDALRRLARATDATRRDRRCAARAARRRRQQCDPLSDLFDLVVAARLRARMTLPTASTRTRLRRIPDSSGVASLARRRRAAFSGRFPEVFLRERRGFRLHRWQPTLGGGDGGGAGVLGLRSPGLKSAAPGGAATQPSSAPRRKPDLVRGVRARKSSRCEVSVAAPRWAVSRMGTGDDLYKAFRWRFWQLAARQRAIRRRASRRSALARKGSAPWRELLERQLY